MRIVECVPNFSEGRDKDKIEAIVGEIEAVPGVKLLDADPGESTNRTVVTFIGEPEAVKEAAFKAIKKAAEVLDMRTHKGAHSRIGATDVCPFVPVSGVTMEDCVRLAHELGSRVAGELGIPVYLYEEAAQKPERRNLANIRAGEYEGLAEKFKDPTWAPDYGEPVFNPQFGRDGHRGQGVPDRLQHQSEHEGPAAGPRDRLEPQGERPGKEDERGDRPGQPRPTRQDPGKFRDVKAVGWYIEDYGVAQISINFTNYRRSPVHAVFDETVKQAEKLGLRVTGSELVGLIPKEALLMAGRHYLEKQGKTGGFPEEEIIRTAVLSLGLNDVSAFDPGQENHRATVQGSRDDVVSLDVRAFADEVSMDSPTPGGGSVAALCGALSAALSSMVANLTYGKKGYERFDGDMKGIAVRAQELKDEFLRAVDLDSRAFNKVIEALRLPKGTEDSEQGTGSRR